MKELLFSVWDLIKFNVLRSLLIITSLFLVPYLSLFNLLFIIIFWNTIIDLLINVEVNINRWMKSTLTTSIVVSSIYLLYKLAGLFGVLGLVLASILVLGGMLAIILISNWKVYDAVTTWGAERILDKHKKPFKLEEVMKHEKKKRRKIKRSVHK